MAKAVANETSATFLRVVGSELIQKYLGDGPKLVRELFRVAEDHAPALIFIDEIDAVGTKRYDSHRYISKFFIFFHIVYVLVVVKEKFREQCLSFSISWTDLMQEEILK